MSITKLLGINSTYMMNRFLDRDMLKIYETEKFQVSVDQYKQNDKNDFILGEAILDLKDLGDVDIALGPHLEENTCGGQVDRFFPLSVVLVRCQHLQDLLVLQGTTKSTRKKSQEYLRLILYNFGNNLQLKIKM